MHLVVLALVALCRYAPVLVGVVGSRRGIKATKFNSELKDMIETRSGLMLEAQKVNSPATFAQYAKFQRQIDKLSTTINQLKGSYIYLSFFFYLTNILSV